MSDAKSSKEKYKMKEENILLAHSKKTELPTLTKYPLQTSLDLTPASRAYILEPQWNPMMEEQALDRVHRIGQTRPVTTIRYVMRNTFEEVS